MLTIRDTIIMLGLCLVFSFISFNLGKYQARADIWESLRMGELSPLVNEIVNQHMAFVPAVGEK